MTVAVRYREAEQAIRRHLGPPAQVRRLLHPPSPEGFRDAVGRLERSIHDLNAKKGLPAGAFVVTAIALHSALDVLLPYMEGRVEEAARRLAVWHGVLSRAEKLPGGTLDALCRLYLETVASEASSALQGSRGEEAIERLTSTLNLSYDDLGRMLGVSGETVRRWARGTGRIPDSHLATLDVAAAALDRLLQLFVPDRLPQVIHRHAELFEGERALDWILRGRIQDVAERYETALMYQA